MIPVQEGPPVFELVPIEDLPAFDAAKTLKTMLLTQEQIRRVNAFRTRWKHVIAFMLQLGNLLMLLTTAAPRRVGSVMAVLAPILQFPGMMLILGSMRIGMLYLLLGTYDFWYFTINNLIFGMCFSAMLLDIRVIVVVVGCVIVQISIGADALVGDRSQILLSSVINCGTHFAMFIAVFLKVVDDNGRGDTFILAYSSSGYGFSIRDTLMNTQLNMILLFGRLWAITLDALPPSAMRLLAFRRSTLMLLVLIFELTGLIVLSLELFALDRWIVPNRAVVDRVILGRHIQESVYYLLAV
ncbi:hypothetical protein KRP22_007118 [Phytophthora ramorum]|nr:hypothetical protein KRP22_1785 [Phytophthora ramorum]